VDRSQLLILSEYLGVIAVSMLAGISPRLKKRPLIFKYPKREGIIASSLLLVILVMNLIIYSQGFLTGNRLNLNNENSLLWARLLISLFCLAPFLVALYIRKQPLLSTGWNKNLLGSAIRLGIALVFLTIFLRGKIFSILNGITLEEGQALLLWLGIAFSEENIFRGYIQPRISAWTGDIPGWIITSVYFTVWHLPRILNSTEDIVLGLVFILIQGLILGWLLRKSGHVLPNILYRSISEWLWFVM